MRYMDCFVAALLAMTFAVNPVYADCTSPAGQESQTRYSGNKLYYCGGGTWREVPGSGGAAGAGCVVGSVYVPSGYTHAFFSADTHADCASVSQARTCTNGVLSGSGTYSHPFCVPLVADTAPDAFSFNDVTNAAPSTLTTPAPVSVTIGGINTSTPVSVSGQGSPQISINGGGWVTSGAITNGQSLAVRLNSASSLGTTYTATIDVGGVTDDWTVTTTSTDPCTTGAIGTTCVSDGAKYIGSVSGTRVYARSADSSSSIRHKNSNSNTTGTDGTTNGTVNTDAMISAGSHPIATTCRAHGSQWYVPARSELTLLWTNRAALNLSSMGINTSGSYYWSSSQDGSPDAWARRFNDGNEGDDFKKDNLCRLRCVRR